MRRDSFVIGVRAAAKSKPVLWRNWAGNLHSKPLKAYMPETEEHIVEIVQQAAKAGMRVKVVGAGHSCSRVAASDGAILVSLDKMNRLLSADSQTGYVTVQAGIRLYELNRLLARLGLALPNLGTIDAQSVAGAISTGTHGTGLHIGGMSSFVVRLRLVTASGDVVEASPHDHAELFHAARTGLGSLGILTSVTLACVPAFRMLVRERPASLDETLNNLDVLVQQERFGFWWFPHTDEVTIKIAENTKEEAPSVGFLRRWTDWFRNVLILNRGHEAAMWLAAKKTSLVPAINAFFYKHFYRSPASRVVTSKDGFRLTILVKQHVMEYAIPLKHTAEAIRRLKKLIEERNYKVHHPVEVRFGAADDAWLSLAYGRETCYIGIIMYRPFGLNVPYEDYFRDVDELFFALGGRPHWGKIHYRTADELRSVYPRWDEFMSVRKHWDPDGMFLNDYLERVLHVDPVERAKAVRGYLRVATAQPVDRT